MFHRTLAASLVCFAFAMPLAALAQSNGVEDGYIPPKLVKRGAPVSPIAGPGTVVIKVLVDPNGSISVEDVIRSTNHANDAAAKEIARNSTYRPATRGGKPILAFYDFTLKFSGASVSTGNSSGTKAGLAAYIAAHPDDRAAQADLGVANALLPDYPAAVAAFDAAGSIPAKYRAIAAKAYAENAVRLTNSKEYPAAIAAAKRSVELSPGVATYHALGFAELGAGDAASAIRDLEKARESAAAGHASAHDRALIASNVTSAYLAAGNLDAAKSAAAEALRLDPTATGAQVAFASYYAKKAKELDDSGRQIEAAAAYELAAEAAPSAATTMYANAAFSYLRAKPEPANGKAKADADKALAIDANSAAANFAAGIAFANQGRNADALTFLRRAETSAKAGSEPRLTASIQAAIQQLSGR